MWNHKCVLAWISRRSNPHEESNELLWNLSSSWPLLFLLQKSLYGARQAGKMWGTILHDVLMTWGLNMSSVDFSIVLKVFRKLPVSVHGFKIHLIHFKLFVITELFQGKYDFFLWRQVTCQSQINYTLFHNSNFLLHHCQPKFVCSQTSTPLTSISERGEIVLVQKYCHAH